MLTLVFEPRPWSPGDEPARVVNRWHDDEGHVFAVGMASERHRWIEWTDLGVFRFHESSDDVQFHPIQGLDASHARDIFVRVVQPLILQAKGLVLLHASAAAGPTGVVVFCGLSGSGKSTLAYALGRRPGFRQVADDAVVIRGDTTGAFVVTPIPFRSRLRAPSARFFSAPATTVSSAGFDDPLPIPLQAIVMLTQTSDSSRSPAFSRIAPSQAFSVLLTHAHCFDEGDRDATSAMVQTYLSMADTVPVFRLAYHPDFAALPHLLAAVSDTVHAAAHR